MIPESVAHLEFRRVPVDGPDHAGTDDEALLGGHGAPLCSVRLYSLEDYLVFGLLGSTPSVALPDRVPSCG